ncbi:MAG TPA: MazG family protein [Candidatus Limnocylindria bacterium]|nr:MazG family protein [Candidatus Limnocylindria bacterium]
MTDGDVPAGDRPGARLLDLVALMDRLRSPGGCPWDAAQTHASLVPYLLEEAYEAVEAVETGDRSALREELGDVLLQVVFHARVASEDPDAPWDVDAVAGDLIDKLVRRHPHVFASEEATTPDEVEASWETLKREEKGRTSAVDGVPLAQPALALAAKLMARAEKSGLHVAVPAALSEGLPDRPLAADEVGALLLAVVARAREDGVDAELALRTAARGYAGAVRAAEARS